MPSNTNGDYAFTKPDVGGSRSSWGGLTNNNWDTADTGMTAIKATANAALPKAGGTMTGTLDMDNQKVLDAKITHPSQIEMTASTPTPGGGSVTVAYGSGNVANVGTVSGTTLSVTISGRPAGTVSGDFHLCWILGNFTNTVGCTITFADSFVYRLGLGDVVDAQWGAGTFHYFAVKGKVCIPIMIQST